MLAVFSGIEQHVALLAFPKEGGKPMPDRARYLPSAATRTANSCLEVEALKERRECGAGSGGRTHTRSEPRQILSLVRLPVPPSRLGFGEMPRTCRNLFSVPRAALVARDLSLRFCHDKGGESPQLVILPLCSSWNESSRPRRVMPVGWRSFESGSSCGPWLVRRGPQRCSRGPESATA